MLSRDEYARAVHAFLGELSASLIGESPTKLRDIPGLEDEVREAANTLRDTNVPLNVVLATALGLIDEYLNRADSSVLDEAYTFYVDQHTPGPMRSN